MGFGNLSISRVDGASAVRPRIAEAQTERARPKRARGASEAAGTRGAEPSKYRSRSSEEGSLTLTTAEGDKVTISFKNSQTAKVDQARLYGPDGSFESTRVKTRETAHLSVSL